MSTETRAPHVPHRVCQKWRDQAADGKPYPSIAADYQWATATVWEHCNRECQHGDDTDHSPRPNDSDAETLVTILREFAAELGRSPTAAEVNDCEFPVTKDECQRVLGTYQDALKAAGLPTVSNRTPIEVRKTVYQHTMQEADR